ncbi:MAG: prolyl oligopeptidase family serine peptidase [Phycisphaerae bacterium]|jgi:dipeptidyl aminopeptidase/acylaminoacyl peptidase
MARLIGHSLVVAASLVALAGCAHTQKPASHAQPAGAVSASGITTPGLEERGPGVEKFFRIRTPGAATIAPDGSLYVRDWPAGVFQLFRVPAGATPPTAAPGTPMQQLTNFKDGLSGYSLSPDGKQMLVFFAAGGNERTQVSLLDLNNTDTATNTTPLLANDQVVFSVNAWLHDSSGFLYTANDTSANDFHIYRYDLASKKSTKLLAKEGSWAAADLTRDGSRALVGQFRSASDSTLQELNTKTGELTNLATFLSEVSTASLSPVGYLPDEKGVLFTSDHEGDGITRLYLRDANGNIRKPLTSLDKYELDGASTNDDRTLLTVSSNEDGYGVMHIYRLPNFEPVKLPETPRGIVSAGSLRGNQLIYSVNSARVPGLAFAYTIPDSGKPAGTPRQVTFADTQGIDLASLSEPQLIKYKSFDGLEIPAFMYLPKDWKPGKPVPFVVDYHGGPEGQHRPGFDREAQYLISEGFGLLLPNVRGSSGYGRNFLMMDDYKKRWDSVKDGVYAAQWLVDQGYATPGKISSYGGSYGGFMAVATLVEDTERVERGEATQRLFGAGCKVVGIVNFQTFLQNTAGYRRKLREAEYGPLSDPEFLDSVSPLLRANKINAPMMLAHGLNDPRVPVGEAMQLAEALQRRGYDPEQVYFHDEGHGFAKLENRLLFQKRLSRFLKKNIGQ